MPRGGRRARSAYLLDPYRKYFPQLRNLRLTRDRVYDNSKEVINTLTYKQILDNLEGFRPSEAPVGHFRVLVFFFETLRVVPGSDENQPKTNLWHFPGFQAEALPRGVDLKRFTGFETKALFRAPIHDDSPGLGPRPCARCQMFDDSSEFKYRPCPDAQISNDSCGLRHRLCPSNGIEIAHDS